MMEGLGFNRYQEHRETGIDWIEQIPADWKTMKAKFLLTESNSRSVSGDEDLLSLSKYHGVIRKDQMSEKAGQAESLVGYKEVEAGDLVINKMQASNGLMAVSQVTGITSPDYAIYKAKKNGAARIDYICHVLRQPEYLAEIKRRAKGVMEGFIRLYTDDLFDLPIILPPLQEQQYILDFLDDKCAKIDGAVKIKEDQIALLRERRQIIIQEAVTRGMNPAAPMKDSGIDWIGQIPAHWEVRNAKWLFSHRKERARKGEPQLAATQKYGVIPQTDFMDLEGRRVVQVFLDFDILKHVEAGDFVMSMRSFQGGIEYSEYTGCVSSAYVALQPGEKVYARYFKYLLKSTRYIEALQSTSNLVRDGQALRFDNFSMVDLMVVPLDEQRQIADCLDSHGEKTEGAIAIKERQIAALKEYKISLINAAVTGKIKVI